MKKLFVLLIGIALMIPCAAQEIGYVTMPDGTTRTMEQLILSAQDMRTYLYSLSGEEKDAVMNEIMMSVNAEMEQINAMKGSALYGNMMIFNGVEFDEPTREMIINCTLNENVNGQQFDMDDFIREGNMDQNMDLFVTQYKQSLPPGYLAAYEWLKITILFEIKGNISNKVKRYTIPLY